MLEPADFSGAWLVQRKITDQLTGQPGRFEGRAVFTPQGSTVLRYEEEGWLQLGQGPRMQASRAYLWQFGDDVVKVRFADGSPFHAFSPGQSGAGTAHQCGADLYQVRYDFDLWPDWVARWQVQGPRKDYGMTSHYARPGT